MKQLIAIPAGEIAVPCKGGTCEEMIYWSEHPTTNKPHPVSVDEVYAAEHDLEVWPPSEPGSSTRYDGQGFSHFATCVDAERFRKRERG